MYSLLRFSLSPHLQLYLSSPHTFYTLQSSGLLHLVLKKTTQGSFPLPCNMPIGSATLATRQEVMEADLGLENAANPAVIMETEDQPGLGPAVPQHWSEEESWPVLAVQTKVTTNSQIFPEKITILVRIPAARGAVGRERVCMLPRSSLTAPSFYDFPSPAMEFQPLEGPAVVEDGLSWLTLVRPTDFKSAVLTVPSGVLVAMCRPEPANSIRTDQLLMDLISQVCGALFNAVYLPDPVGSVPVLIIWPQGSGNKINILDLVPPNFRSH